MSRLLDALLAMISGALNVLGSLLPQSPMLSWATVTADMRLGIGFLNWVMPIADMLAVFGLWLGLGLAVGVARFIFTQLREVSPLKALG